MCEEFEFNNPKLITVMKLIEVNYNVTTLSRVKDVKIRNYSNVTRVKDFSVKNPLHLGMEV